MTVIGGNMSSIGLIWGIAKTVATKIPWGRVVEHAPVMVDLVGRAKDRLRGSSGGDLEERLIAIHDENLKLEKTLQETSRHLQELTNTLKVLSARQAKLSIATGISLLLAISSLLLWAMK